MTTDSRRELAMHARELAFVQAFCRLHLGRRCLWSLGRVPPVVRHDCPLYKRLEALVVGRALIPGKV